MQTETNKPIAAVVNHIVDEVSNSLDSARRLFPGRGVEVAASVLGGLLSSACALALSVGMKPEEFAAICKTYMAHEVEERAARCSHSVGERR